jgi:hypothetical protein
MKKLHAIVILLLIIGGGVNNLLITKTFAQTGNVGIGTGAPDISAMLDITSLDKGVLIPRVALDNDLTVFKLSGDTKTESMLVYNTNATVTEGTGFYYWNGSKWIKIATGSTATTNTLTTTSGGGTLTSTVNGVVGGPVDLNDALVKKDITALSGSVVSVTDGAGQVVGSTNVGLDVKGTGGGVLYGTNTSSAFTPAGTAGQILKSNAGAAPAWANPVNVFDFKNGLDTTSPNIVEWGGTLTKNTTITQGNYNTVFNLTGTGDFDIQDNGTSAFFVGDNGNVGIGTNLPETKLHVNGDVFIPDGKSYWIGVAADIGDRLRLHHRDTNAYIDYGTADLQFRTTPTPPGRLIPRVVFKIDGRVGIGTETPTMPIYVPPVDTVKLDVRGGNLNVDSLNGKYKIYGTLGTYDSRSVNQLPEKYINGFVPEFKQNNTNGLNDGGTYNGVLSFRSYGSGTDFSGGGVHQMGFTQNGNIWHRYSETAGTWGPWKKLLDDKSGWSLTGNAGTVPGTNFIGTTDAIDWVIKTSNAERVRVMSGGNVGIGTAAPSAKLHIVTDAYPQLRIAPVGGGSSAVSRPSAIDFYSTFDNYPTDQGPRRTATIKAGYSGGTWDNEYMSFHVGGAGDAANEPLERVRIFRSGDVSIQGVLVSGDFIEEQFRAGTGGAVYHTVVFSSTNVIMQGIFIDATGSYLGGNIRIQGVDISPLLSSTSGWYGLNAGATASGSTTNTVSNGADGQFHTAQCPDDYVASGIEIYAASDALDGYMKLRCTKLAPGRATTQGGMGRETTIASPYVDANNTTYRTSCPTGTFVKGIRIWASSRLDNLLSVFCTGIK